METQTLDEVDKSLEQAALAAAQMAQMAQATVPVPVAVPSNVTKAPNWEGHHGKLMQNRILTSLQKFMKDDMKTIMIFNGKRSEN